MVRSTILLVAVLALVVSIGFANGLAMSAVLDAEGKFHVSWEFNEKDITFEVTVQTKGYVGLGFSPNGDMPGSDIVIGWVEDTTGKGYISDQYAKTQTKPEVDEIQDYTLLSSNQNATHTYLLFKRPLKLCDPNDHYLKDETVRLIWAYNDKDPSDGGAPSYHLTNRGSKSVFLLNPLSSEPPMPDDVIYEEFLNPSTPIPVKDTTYWCQAFSVPRLEGKHHVIKVEPIVTPGLEAEIHHILLYGCYHNTSNTTVGKGHECYHPNMPNDFGGCTAVVYAWAVGGGPLYLPAEAGLPFGYDGDPTMILMETHYDNPQLKSGLVDTSGVKMTLTPTLRAHDAGIIEAGVAVYQNHVIPPGAKSFRTNGHCYPQCLEQAMENSQEKLTVFGYMLHEHLAGHAMRIRHFRKGSELPLIAEDNHYDFNFQETRLLPDTTSVLPGDHFVVECDYKTDKLTTMTYGGLSTREEMCLGFLLYYPRIKLSNCQSSLTYPFLAKTLGAEAGFNGTITSPPKWQGKSVHDVLENEITWNQTTRDSFEKAINEEGVDGVYPICSNGKKAYPIMSATKPRPVPIWELPERNDDCGGIQAGADALRTALWSAILSAIAGYFLK